MPICVCDVPLRTIPGNDWLNLQCRTCGSCFCFSCGRAPHFPALCHEAMEWNAVDNPPVRECQRQWNLLNQQLNTVRFLKNSYEEHEDPAYFALFYSHHPDLQYAIMEMEAIGEICRWLSVIFRRHPQVAAFLSEDYLSLNDAFTALLVSFPLPGAEEVGDLGARRLEASLAVSNILAKLHVARIANPPFQPLDAAVAFSHAIQNELEVVPPITLFEFDGPTIDVTYLALLHLERILWQFTYHQRHN